MTMVQVTLEVNGRQVAHEASPRMHLGDFLRDQARLTGTHLGCEHGVCGACTVLVDGQPVRSCITYAVACEGRQVTTIEGYDGDPVMARLRAAFTKYHALQCGYCTPGMLTTSRDIVLRMPDADEARVRVELSGNLCRCTGYMGIVGAVMSVLRDLREQPDAAVQALRAAAPDGRLPAPRGEQPI
ncbi:(2Fe-2S)-binding protein, partial [Bordetella pertussis]|uniref:(2Fe-2S)-binding protein n=1 Tax=Bordetella pertussis TaxID=520 RepID=UPI0030C8DB1F